MLRVTQNAFYKNVVAKSDNKLDNSIILQVAILYTQRKYDKKSIILQLKTDVADGGATYRDHKTCYICSSALQIFVLHLITLYIP